MIYKALMLDVDGTLIPYDFESLPSDKVAEAIQKAQEKVTVCLVTGRSVGSLIPILKKLHIHNGYLVTDNGAHVITYPEKKILYEKLIAPEDAEKISEILFANNFEFFYKSDITDEYYAERPIQKGQKIENASMIYAEELYPLSQIDKACAELSRIPTISVNKAKHKYPDKYGLNICHIQATKLHGVEIVMKELGIQREEIIAAGDSYNDFPLLMAAGTKVAMGNAIPDLKAIADFVAPSVTEDGVVTVIEKFILSEK